MLLIFCYNNNGDNMGYKTKLLDNLRERKINVHEYKEVFTKKELIEYSKNNKYFSIRFDTNKKTHNLPFYVVDNNYIDFDKILNEAKKLNASLLLSNGREYDKYLLFNFVIEIDNDYNYILEICNEKVPLRNMYNYKTSIIKGNLMSSKYEIINNQDNEINKNDIDKIINFCLLHNNYKYIEGSFYNKNVGIYKDKIVLWQTD